MSLPSSTTRKSKGHGIKEKKQSDRSLRKSETVLPSINKIEKSVDERRD